MIRPALAFAFTLAGGLVAGEGVAAPSAPSFDCAKASSPFEKAICADPALAKADRELAAAYASAQATVPAPWKDWLRQTQRSWLKFAAAECKSGDLGGAPTAARKAACRRNLFSARIATLNDTLVTKAGKRFVALTSYRAGEGEDEDSTSTLHITLLQIAEPAGAGERAWNQRMVELLGDLSSDQPAISGEAKVAIDAVGPGYIGATVSETHARGPGGDSTKLEAVRFSTRQSRDLGAADLFRDPASARAAIARVILRNPELKGDETAEEALRVLLQDERYWVIRHAGLSLTFDDDNAFGGAHYAAAVLSTTIPWADLAPYLKPDLPLDLKALEDAP